MDPCVVGQPFVRNTDQPLDIGVRLLETRPD